MRHIDNYLQTIQEIDPITGVMVGLSAASLMLNATNTFKKHFAQGAKQCSDLQSKEKSLCMLRVKVLSKKVELASLKGNVSKCSKTKNPQDCRAKIQNKIKKLSSEIKYFNKRFADAKKEGY